MLEIRSCDWFVTKPLCKWSVFLCIQVLCSIVYMCAMAETMGDFNVLLSLSLSLSLSETLSW